MHGEGHYKWLDGREYIGTFSLGKKEGLGRYFWPDGRKFFGFWRKGKQHGIGKYINESNDVQYGIWANGKRNQWLDNEEIAGLKNDHAFILINSLSLDENNQSSKPNERKVA